MAIRTVDFSFFFFPRDRNCLVSKLIRDVVSPLKWFNVYIINGGVAGISLCVSSSFSLSLSVSYNRVDRFGLGRMFKRAEGSVSLKKNLFPQRDSRQPVTRESTRHEFVLFYDICRRLIFSANRLSASKWSSRRNEEGCRARGVARGLGGGRRMGGNRRIENGGEGTRWQRNRRGSRERRTDYAAAYLRIRGN